MDRERPIDCFRDFVRALATAVAFQPLVTGDRSPVIDKHGWQQRFHPFRRGRTRK